MTVYEPFQGSKSPQIISLNNPDGISIPVKRVVCTSTSQLHFLELLDETDKLVGFPTLNFISSELIQDKTEKGSIVDLGKDAALNIEQLIKLKPDIVVAYSISNDLRQWERIERLGIQVVFDASYLEPTPLAQAEWIKFFGFLLGKEKAADSVFNKIEKSYQEVLEMANRKGSRPTVIGGSLYNGTWFMPGGNSWVASYIRDAGGNYLWSHLDQMGSSALTFETVYEHGRNADIWIGATAYGSISSILQSDERFGFFQSVIDSNVFSPTKRITKNGGNDYYESGVARPDLVLKDLVKMLHPEVIPDYELVYFKNLKY